jgi:hypothetical protein
MEPDEARRAGWVERIAWLMDSSIPLGRWSVGLDGIIGLVPGVGDYAGAMVSLLIVAAAVHAGVPRIAIARMIANIGLDTLVGAIPFAGDLFDFGFKANIRNARIYREAIATGRTARHWGFFLILAVAVIAIAALPLLLAIWLVRMR